MDQDMLPGLPDGWAVIPFEESIIKIPATGKKLKQSDYIDVGAYPVIDQGQEFIGGYTDQEDLLIEADYPVVVFGDHTKVIKYITFPFVAGADGIKILKPLEIFYPKLFYYFLHCLEIPDRGYSRHFQFLEKKSLPVPPYNEQLRIVEAIETQFTRIDEGVKLLQRLRDNLKRYKAAVLKAACEGRLVPQDPDDEPASDLLKRILQERRAKWEAGGRKGKYVEPQPPDTADLPDLPDGWVWASVEQICERIVDCLHSTPHFTGDGFICIDTNAIKPGRIIQEKLRFVDEDTFIERNRRMKPEHGDIMFSREGALLGVAVQVPENLDLCLGQRMMIFRLSKGIQSKYYEMVLNSTVFRSQYVKKIGGTASPHLNISDIRLLAIPLPSTNEQLHIILEHEELLSIVEALEEVILHNLSRAERLRQSILKQAFEGKLVPQDPSDEPASVLLRHIQSSRKQGRGKQ